MSYSGTFVEYYDQLYAQKDYQREIEFIKAADCDAKSILDVGCGTGTHALLLSQEGADLVVGVDIAPEMIERAKRKSGTVSNVQFIHGDIFSNDLLKVNSFKRYDMIISLFHVINHLTSAIDLMKFFKKAKELLRTNGTFVFDCWNGVGVFKELPRNETKVFNSNELGPYSVKYSSTANLMNSQVDMKMQTMFLYPTTQENFEQTLTHYIWTPKLIQDLLKHEGFKSVVAYKTYEVDQQATEKDYKIVFVCR